MTKRILFWLVLFGSRTLYAGVFTAELDKTVGPIDEEFVCTFTVSGDHDKEPSIPEIDGLRVTGAGTSSNLTIINGNASRSTEYRFVIQPLKEGQFEIPSVTLKVDGVVQKSAPLRFRVQPAGTTTDGGPAVAFVKRELSAKKVYLGETLVAKVKIYFREKLAQAQEISEPNVNFRSFKSENRRTYTEEVDGTPYRVHELTEVLVPTKVGKLTLNPFVLEAHVPDDSARRRSRGTSGLFEDFFGGALSGNFKRKVLRSKEDEIEVLPVPERDKPANFSGLVGSFQLEASLGNNQIKTGETATLTVSLSGSGVVDQLEQIKLSLPDHIKVYPDKPITEQVLDDDRGFQSQKDFKFAIVPTEPGTFELPPVTISVFVPKLGSYVELTADLPELTVTGERESIGAASQPEARKLQVKKLAEDLINIHRGNQLMKQHQLVAKDFWVVALISGFPTFALCLGWILRRRKRTINAVSVQQKRRSRAYRKLAAILKEVGESGPIFAAFREYIGDVSGVKGGAITEKDALTFLAQKHVKAEVLNEFSKQWSLMSKAEYGGGALKETDLSILKASILSLAKEIDRQC